MKEENLSRQAGQRAMLNHRAGRLHVPGHQNSKREREKRLSPASMDLSRIMQYENAGK